MRGLSLLLLASIGIAQEKRAPDLPLRLRDAASARCGWGTAHDDASVGGEPLSVGDVVAEAGIGTHAPAELEWKVADGATWFTCWFGVAAERGANGSIALEVWIDGERKFASAVVKGGATPLWVVVPVTGGKQLKLVVTDGGDGNGADHCNLLWPTLWRNAAEPKAELPAAITFVGKAAPPSLDVPCLWSDRPATKFVEAYPLGDGRLGATWFGGVAKDRIVLNEISMWSGSVDPDADRPTAHENLPKIRELLRAGKYVEAEKLVNETFTCAGKGSGHGNGKDVPFGCYQTLGELEITWLGKDGKPWLGEVRDYARIQEFSPNGARVQFSSDDGVTATRGLQVHRGIKLSLSSGTPMDLNVTLHRRDRAHVAALGRDGLRLNGALANGRGGDGVHYELQLRVIAMPFPPAEDPAHVVVDGTMVQVRRATEVKIVVAAATNYDGPVANTLDYPGWSPASLAGPSGLAYQLGRAEQDVAGSDTLARDHATRRLSTSAATNGARYLPRSACATSRTARRTPTCSHSTSRTATICCAAVRALVRCPPTCRDCGHRSTRPRGTATTTWTSMSR